MVKEKERARKDQQHFSRRTLTMFRRFRLTRKLNGYELWIFSLDVEVGYLAILPIYSYIKYSQLFLKYA